MVTTECILFAGSVNTDGYGMLFDEGKQLRAHRVMYESLVGEIPLGKHIDHLCRVRLCINPDHMEPVTNVMNIMRGEAPSAQNARKTHCNEGHEFTDSNTHYRSNGWRICKQCHAKWMREYRAKQKNKV